HAVTRVSAPPPGGWEGWPYARPVTPAGLPEAGPGSMAPAGPRLAAFLVDVVLSSLVAALFTLPDLPRNRSLLVFAVLYFGFTVLVGQTPGMRLAKLRVIRLDR